MTHMRAFNHLSLWDIAHRWHETDPSDTDPAKLPLAIKDTLRALTHALAQDRLHVLSAGGVEHPNHFDVPTRPEYRERTGYTPPVVDEDEDEADDAIDVEAAFDFDLYSTEPIDWGAGPAEDGYGAFYEDYTRQHREAVHGLYPCIEENTFDKARFEATHLDRGELLEYCLDDEVTPPGFWFAQADIDGARQTRKKGEDCNDPTKGRHAESRQDRELCRAIAATLWAADPALTINAIAEHDALQRYGNGRLYQGRDTIRNWIKDLDPRPSHKRVGRPRKAPQAR